MKSSTKKYFNSDKKFNKRIKKQASALPLSATTTTLQTDADQQGTLGLLQQTQLEQERALQQEATAEYQQQLEAEQQRTQQAVSAIPQALTTAKEVSSTAKDAIAALGQKGAKVAGKGFAKTSTAVAPVALAATLAGEGIKYFSADDDDTKYNAGEIGGGLLSGAGQGASYGALAGSIIPGFGNVAGAAIGATIGAGVSGAKMLIDRKNAREGQELEDRIKSRRDTEFAQRNTDLFNQAFGAQGRDLGYNVGSSVSNSYLPGFQRAETGGKKVPGGVIKPLPFGAVEFRGNKHGESGKGSDSGIILEEGGKMSPGVEVEDKETMDKVKFANGREDDYIFSSYLKLGGKSFAQRHKEILQSGGDQEQIQNLAKMQEEKAKEVERTPVGPTDQYGPRGQEYIAKYGGVRKKYQAGMGPIAGRQSNYNSSMVRPIEEVAAYHKAMGKDSFWYKFKPYDIKDFFKDEVVEFPKTFQQLDSAKYSVPLNIPQPTPQPKQYGGRMKAQTSLPPEQQARVEESKNLLDAIDAGAIQAGDYAGAQVAAQSAAANAAAADTPVQTLEMQPTTLFPYLDLLNNPNFRLMMENAERRSQRPATQTSAAESNEATTDTTEFNGQGLTPDNTPNLPAGMAWFDNGDGTWSIIPSVAVGEAEVVTKRKRTPLFPNMPYEEETGMQTKENKDESTLDFKKEQKLNIPPPRVRDVPPLAYLGTAAQLLGPLMALRTSYPEPQKISAGVQGLTKLGRVNFNAERATNINSSTAANRFIQNTSAGPAAIAATIASNNAAREGSMQLASQEARTNMQLANAEEQLNANIVAQNMARDLQAQGLNTEAQNMLDQLEYQNRINAFDTMGAIGAQFASDVMQYKATEREARANQIAGEYTREGYVTAMQNRPKYRRMLKEAGIDPNDTRTVQRIAAEMYNPNMTLDEQEEMFRQYVIELNKTKEKEDKRFGGYIKKYGKVSKK
jgi:hypothetical protein